MAETPIRVRDATRADIEALVNGCRALAEETEARALDEEVLRRGVAACFEDQGRGRYLVAHPADDSGHVQGQLMLTREWSDWRNGWFWWIQSVYVPASSRRRGVYTALHDHVVERARFEPDVCGVRLYVHQRNTDALATYLALRMQRTDYGILEIDFGAQDRG